MSCNKTEYDAEPESYVIKESKLGYAIHIATNTSKNLFLIIEAGSSFKEVKYIVYDNDGEKYSGLISIEHHQRNFLKKLISKKLSSPLICDATKKHTAYKITYSISLSTNEVSSTEYISTNFKDVSPEFDIFLNIILKDKVICNFFGNETCKM